MGVDFMKFNSNSGRTLFMTFIIVLVFVLIGAIAYFGITSYPEVITDLKIKIEKTFNKEKENTSNNLSLIHI